MTTNEYAIGLPEATTLSGLTLDGLTFSYSPFRKPALEDISLHVPAHSITGIFGRNGSGKSTLGMLAAGMLHSAPGQVTWEKKPVYEKPTMGQIAYISDATPTFEDEQLRATMNLWATTRSTWDEAYATELLEAFGLSPKAHPSKLSRGQLSAFHAVLGLASRCPLTIFDEVHLGMDAVVRDMFYRALLADYTRHPRTILLSSHLIDEVEQLLSYVVFLDHGHLLEEGDPDDIRARHSEGGELSTLTDVLSSLTLTDTQRAFLGGVSR